ADNSQGMVGSQQSQDENLRLKGATVVSNLAIAGGKKVEQFKNWLGEDNAETAALILMAAAGGPVKTLGSTLWAATPMAGYLQEKKEQYLVNPLTPLIGANAFGAETDRDQQAVQPASHATSSMLVDTLLSSLGVMGTKAGVIGIIKSSDGFSGVLKDAEEHISFPGSQEVSAAVTQDGTAIFTRSVDPKILIGRQGRDEISGSQVKRFTKDMKANGYDVNHPIDVANVEGKLIIVDGHHRALAAPRAGIKNVPVNVHDVTKEQADQLMREAAEARGRR
ncbi:ParB/RepB/Spo0J family partition protein, partial [Xanthomonas citri]|uniref:ParB/RepB/Spo0J family partition protein n=1 Tax=Xanthomonas citri TaxID=346 RepID=UPI0030C8AF87